MVKGQRKKGYAPIAVAAVCAAAVAAAGVNGLGVDGLGIVAASAVFPAHIPEGGFAGENGNSQASEQPQQTADRPAFELWAENGEVAELERRYAVYTDNTGANEIPEQNRGPIQDVTYGSGTSAYYLNYKSGNINNRTNFSNSQIAAELEKELGYSIELNSNQPQVLIYHTHTTESFDRYTAGYYDRTYPTRTTDPELNIVSVGAITAEVLNAAGINTIHCQTIHDHQYNGSYSRSRESVQQLLEQYPSIKVILDFHRDGIESNGVRMRPIVEIDGAQAAQFMIISAADDNNSWDFFENLRLAARIQSAAGELYPGLARPVSFKYTTYNQDLSPGALLVEVGSHGNSLEDVQYTGYLLGIALADALGDISG